MKSILLAEDEDSSIALFEAMLLNHPDWRLSVAHSGQEAIDFAEREPPDLAVLDIAIPIVDGLEVCRRLKTDPRTESIPIIIVTALTQQVDRSAAMAAGAAEFVTKPFSVHDLQALVEDWLERAPGA